MKQPTIPQPTALSQKRIRALWIIALFTAIDAWLAVLSMWMMVYFLAQDQIIEIGRSLGYLCAFTASISVLVCIILLSVVPKEGSSPSAMINKQNICLVMSAAMCSVFLCMIYSSVHG